MQENEKIVENVTSRIKSDWITWREVTGVLFDKNVPLKVNGMFFKTFGRPEMMHIEIKFAEMWTLRWMYIVTRTDIIRNKYIRENLGATNVARKIRKMDYDGLNVL